MPAAPRKNKDTKTKQFNNTEELYAFYEANFALENEHKREFLSEIDSCKTTSAKEKVVLRHINDIERAINLGNGPILKSKIFNQGITDLDVLYDNAEKFSQDCVKDLEEDYGVLNKSDYKKLNSKLKENLPLDITFCVKTGALGKVKKDVNAGIYSLLALKNIREYLTKYVDRNNLFDHEINDSFKEFLINNHSIPGNSSYQTAIVIANELKIISILQKQNMINQFNELIASLYKVELSSVESGVKGMLNIDCKSYCYNKKNVKYTYQFLIKYGNIIKADDLKKRYTEYFKD